MNSADLHVYYDAIKSTKDILKSYLIESENKFIVLSPPCTSVTEPKKSRVAYYLQHTLSNYKTGRIVQKLLSKSFYNKKNELKLVFRLFSKKLGKLEKIDRPANHELLEKFCENEEIKLWCWINPKDEQSRNDFYLLNNRDFYGIKFHMFWHNLSIEDIRTFLSDHINIKKPIYLILDWIEIKELECLIRDFNNLIWIIGYGGFPITVKSLGIVGKLENVYIDIASFHISRKWMKKISKEINNRKILYSTDFPYNFDGGEGGKFSTKLFDKRLTLNGINVVAIRENSFNLVNNGR